MNTFAHTSRDDSSLSSIKMKADMSRTQLHDGIRGIYSRMHKIMGLRRRKQDKRRVEISAPFNFQKVNMELAGVSADELCLLKEQAMASQIGISDPDPYEETQGPARRPLHRAASGPLSISTSASSPSLRPSLR